MGWKSLQICDECWERRCELKGEVGRIPYRIVEGIEQEECCDCGLLTESGIYIRAHTDQVPFPPREDK